jgi:hypothetical protein
MLIVLLIIVIALVAWALHLMQEAVTRQEFSLMLAGTLVAFSAAGLMGVYFLVGDYMGYLTKFSHIPTQVEAPYEVVIWSSEIPTAIDAVPQVSLNESPVKTVIP